jgi:nitronate monooxygenase
MTAIGTPPLIIQGGMGAAVSNWFLARATALRGQLGVVSGTGIDTVLVRRLQDGDAGGHMRRAMALFPTTYHPEPITHHSSPGEVAAGPRRG